MSHNNPYRRPPLDSDLRPDPGPYSSSDHRHAPLDHDIYRSPQESCSSSFPSSSSSSRGIQFSQDGALSILSSCGLEPADLALLAKLPEDVLTVESLPHVLQQIKGKRCPIAPLTPIALSSSYSCSSYPRSSAGLSAVNLSATNWDHHRSQPLQYPPDQVTPSPLSSDLDRWGNPRTTGSVRVQAPSASSSSSGSMVDYHHRLGPSEYGKVGRDAGPGPSQDQNSFSSAGGAKRTQASRFSEPGSAEHRSAPPPEQLHQKPHRGHHESETSSMRSSSRPAANMPSEPEALDFHGTTPPWYPYSCSLCDITVMSERVWIKHINGAQHADGQLGLLQRFPNWDCRMETVSRTDHQPEKRKDEDKPGQQPKTADQDSKLPANKKSQKKTSDKGKVVCVKFPANSVDEAYLRKLTEPFGKIVKIIMFPSLAFVELGSIDQAKDLVKFHVNYPPTVNGQQMEFRITNTFTFLQSSRVVSFAPAPTEENGQSDLMSVVKRFGSPLYTLFLPSMAFVEMKNSPDAQKLVDYYYTNTLRINKDCIKVSFSGEYKSLMRVASAKRYKEEKTSSSREKEDKTTERKQRRRTTDQEESSREMKTRSRSRERFTKEKRSRSRERSTKEETERSRSTDTSSRDKRTRTRSKSREKSQNKFSIERRSRSKDTFGRDKRTRTRSKSSEKSSSERKSRSSVVTVKTEPTVTESRTDPDPVRESKPEAEVKQQTEETESSAEESDIEGMEVIGEDGETLKEDDVEDDEDEAAEKNSPDGDKERVKPEEVDEEEEKVKPEEVDEEEEKVKPEEVDEEEEKVKPEEVDEEEEKVKDKEVDEEMMEAGQEAISEMEQEEEQTSETAETQLEDNEEEPDFPVDLENCITLDELEEEQTENRDEDDPDEPKSLSNRVIYFRNLPRRPYTDREFLNLVKDFGTPGFIEMSTSSEAQRAVKELGIKRVTLKGSKLIVQMSTRYKRLSYGFSDAQVVEEKRGERRSWRSERLNKDEPNRRSEGKKESSKKGSTPEKTPENESKSKKNQKKSKTASKNSSPSPEKESVCKSTSEETSGAPENESVNKKTSEEEPVSRKCPEESLSHDSDKSCRAKTEEKDLTAEKTPETESLAETSEENKMSERKETDENDEEEKEESESHKTEDKMEFQEKEQSEDETPGPELRGSKSPDQPDSTGDSPEPQTEQEPAADRPRQQSESAGGAAEVQEPTKPVGTEFVRPVVGYFCNLCQVIYADEDEAKQQHCSSLTHYRKYQEKMGKDPWTS